MQIDRATAETLAREGVAALQRGDGETARERFASLVDAGHAAPPMCLMLARACRLGGDSDAEAAAIDRALAGDPDNLQALLMRGECSARAGDPRAATSYFHRALAVAQKTGVPPAVTADMDRAQAYLRSRSEDYKRSISEAVAGVDGGAGSAGLRLRHSVEILRGEREIYPQQPSVFYYPYLAQRQFFEREEFDWVEEFEAATPDIEDELLDLIGSDAEFQPYVQAEKDRPPRDFHGLLNNPSWTALYFWKDGAIVEENARRCPKTMAALEKVPLSRIGSRTPSVHFSRLLPGAHIPPHSGMLNSRLICHLPLIIPPGCWLRVGNETRKWEEGKLLIFDDSIEHEAKNPSDEVRIILLFDIWRPELTEPEKQGISAMFDAIDQYQGVPADR